MAVSRALRRLLRIRTLEEEQGRAALEAGMGDLRRLELARERTEERDRAGRRLLNASAATGELPDRLAGLEEVEAADRWQRGLTPRIAEGEREVAGLRAEYLARRVERRQAETLVEESEARAALEGERKSQQGLDDWFRNRLHREELEGKDAEAGSSGGGSGRGGSQNLSAEVEKA